MLVRSIFIYYITIYAGVMKNRQFFFIDLVSFYAAVTVLRSVSNSLVATFQLGGHEP